jgi:hypothetical protein
MRHREEETTVLHNDDQSAGAAQMITLAAAARSLNRATPTLLRWSEAGAFPPFTTIKGRRYVFEADVRAWLQARRQRLEHAA